MLRPTPKPEPLRGTHARLVAGAEGDLFEDIAADVEAADALATSSMVDGRRDPLIVEMTRLFGAIEHDLSTSRASRALATRGKAIGIEAIRLDRIVAEHDARAVREVGRSIGAGQAVLAVHEALLTGRPS